MLEADRKYNRRDFWEAAQHFNWPLTSRDIAEQADDFLKSQTPTPSPDISAKDTRELEDMKPDVMRKIFIESFFGLHFINPPDATKLITEGKNFRRSFNFWKEATKDFYANKEGDISQGASHVLSELSLPDMHAFAENKVSTLRKELVEKHPGSIDRQDFTRRYSLWKSYEKVAGFAAKEEALNSPKT